MKKIFSLFVALTAVFSLSAKTLYLAPNANWLKENARFAIYTIDDESWVDMTAVKDEANLFSAEVGDAIAKVIFCRMNPAAPENKWDNKWNQTNDLDLVEGKDLYTVADGAWDKGDGAWSKHEAYVSPWKEIKFTAATAAGSFNDSVFEVDGFKMTCVDVNSKHKTNESSASFADDKEKNDYTFRFQTGGKSSANNKLILTIPADGVLRLAVVTGSDGDKERMVSVTQGESKLLEEHAWDKDEKKDGSFPYLQVNVKKGAVELGYTAAVNFYALGFLAGGSAPEPPAEEDPKIKIAGGWDEWTLHDMTLAGDKKTATYEIELKKGDFLFKLIKDDKWISKANDGQPYGLHREWVGVAGVKDVDSDNLKLTADVDGKYIFTWTFENDSIGITFPEKGDTPEPPADAKFYITGNKALVGAELEWNPAAIKVTEDSYTFKSLAVGDYVLKITLDGDWKTAKGFDDLTEKAEGLTKGDNGNICFTLEEAGDVTVTYTAEAFKVEGKFAVKPADPTVKFYITGNKALVGAELEWNPAAIKVTEDSYTFKALAVGDYLLKITLDGTWQTAKGFDDLTEKAEGLTKGDNGNICFTLEEAGDVTVTYTAEAFKVEGNFAGKDVPQLETGFYLVGTLNDWKPAAEYHFTGNPDNPAEFMLTVTLAVEDKIKVVNVLDNNITAWYPAGEGNDYVVDAAHAGEKTIYFNPDYQEGWAAFGGYFWIDENSGDAINNTAADVKTVKVIRNGQLLIIKGDKTFNAQGAQVK